MSDHTELPLAATVVLVRDGERGPEVLMVCRPDHGSFAGAWVFPGGKIDDHDRQIAGVDADEIALARVAAVRETREEVGLGITADELVTVSCWTPPIEVPLRIRTWFFVCAAPDGVIVPQVAEVDEHLWIAPTEALDRHSRGDFLLYPPTWVTLFSLSDQADSAGVLAEARRGGIRYFTTQRMPNEHTRLSWPGLDIPDLQTATLPWAFITTQAHASGL